MSGEIQTGRTIELEGGRLCGFAEYGDPKGRPVFYFHGFPGSRLDYRFLDPDDAARGAGARIIAVDRPGGGLSHESAEAQPPGLAH